MIGAEQSLIRRNQSIAFDPHFHSMRKQLVIADFRPDISFAWILLFRFAFWISIDSSCLMSRYFLKNNVVE